MKDYHIHELYNLRFDDIVVVDSIVCLKLINKNNLCRVIPLHRYVIDKGFLDYVYKNMSNCNNNQFLFKKQNVSMQSFNRWFNERYLTKIGIKRHGLYFSSFRKTFINAILEPTLMMDSIANTEYRILVNQYMGLTDTYFASHAAFVKYYHPNIFRDILSNVKFNLPLD